ncbi:hypothetical protein BS17DRAFT_773897 [Gyrodon lividus]|nr:hypothetical protein BS17DRAFT_773897 [Gyrodon lividus]
MPLRPWFLSGLFPTVHQHQLHGHQQRAASQRNELGDCSVCSALTKSKTKVYSAEQRRLPPLTVLRSTISPQQLDEN